MLCRAEFACGASRKAGLTHTDRSGNQRTQPIRLLDAADGSATFVRGDLLEQEGAEQEWALACEHPALRVRNRFRAEEVARCTFNWSFRGAAGLTIKMSVVSPEVELASGQQLTLTSDYDLKDFRLS